MMDNHSSRRNNKEKKQVASSLIFQVIIYFNIWYSMIHFILSLLLYIKKYNEWFIKVGVIIPVGANYSVWVLTEFIRLPLGYIGNASERMALLSAYVLFTLFPSLCETIFLCIPIDGVGIPAIQMLNMIQMVFQVSGMIFGWFAINNISKVHTESFIHEVQTTKLKKLSEEKEEKKD